MSFLALSLEVREQIYQELLCPPGGIIFKCDWSEWYSQIKPSLNRRDHYYQYSVGNAPPQRTYLASTIHTAILYVSRQIYCEAFLVLYRSRKLTFNISAKAILNVLRAFPNPGQRLRDIDFGYQATFSDDWSCWRYWTPLCRWLGRKDMHLSTVTIQVPPENSGAIDDYLAQNKGFFGDRFYWDALHRLFQLLMKGKIEKLRLKYCTKDTDDKDEKRLRRRAAVDYLKAKAGAMQAISAELEDAEDEMGGDVVVFS